MPRKPTDLTISGTLRYLEDYLPADSRIMDAGCGAGELAGELKEAGHRVIGLDVDEGAVDKARALGVEARQTDFLHLEGETFDAIVFSFSLHHIFPLEMRWSTPGASSFPAGSFSQKNSRGMKSMRVRRDGSTRCGLCSSRAEY